MAGVFVRHRRGVACDYYSSSARQELGGSKGEDHSRRKCDVLGPDARGGGARCESGYRAKRARAFGRHGRRVGDAPPSVLARVVGSTRAEDERRARRAAARDADLCVTRSAGAGGRKARVICRVSRSRCAPDGASCRISVLARSTSHKRVLLLDLDLDSLFSALGPDTVVEVRRVEPHHRGGPGLKYQRPEGDFRPLERRAERVL